MTREQIEQAESTRRDQVAAETRRIIEADHQRQLREQADADFRHFRVRHPGLSREHWESLSPTFRTSAAAFKEDLSPRAPDAMSRAIEEQRRRESQARVELSVKRESEKEEQRKVAEAKLEEALKPERERLMRQWLANHPGKSEQDFAPAWQHLRPNVVAEREERIRREQTESLRASGQYSF